MTQPPLDTLTLADLLDQTAAKQPTPGGGAVAAIIASISAALAGMVINYSLGKKNLADHQDHLRSTLDQLDRIRHRALELAAEDVEAYGHVNELQRLPEDDPRRTAEWTDAVHRAIDAPAAMLDLALTIITCCNTLTGRSNHWLRSDLAIAAIGAEAAGRAAAWNVRINLPLLKDPTAEAEHLARIDAQLATAQQQVRAIEAACLG